MRASRRYTLAPKILFEAAGDLVQGTPVRVYDVTPDGRRFLIQQDRNRLLLTPTHMIPVQNWVEELKRRVPTK